MKSFNNIIFLISMILFSQIYSNSLRANTKNLLSNGTMTMDTMAPKPNATAKVWNEDKNGTEDASGLWSYAVKGGGENWQLEAMRQSRKEEMTEAANKTIINIPKDEDWYLFVMDMAKRINALKMNTTATKDDWEIMAYVIKIRTMQLQKNLKAKGTGENCQKLAEITLKRVILLGDEKTTDTFKKIDEYLAEKAPICKTWGVPGIKKKECKKKTKKLLLPVYDPAPLVRRFVTIEESINTAENC